MTSVRELRRLVPHQTASTLLVIGTATVYALTNDDRFIGGINDTVAAAAPAFTLATQGSLDVSTIGLSNWVFAFGEEAHSDRFPGAILFAAPFYAVVAPTTFSPAPASFAAAIATALAVLFLHRALLKIVSAPVALGAALLFAFATGAWTVAADQLWSHGPNLLGISLGAWALARDRPAVAGIGYALAIMSRPHSAVIAATAAVGSALERRSLKPALQLGATSLLGVLGLLAWNRVNAGRWTILTGSYGGRLQSATTAGSDGAGGQADVSLWIADIAATFGSPLRGILVLSPFLILLLPGVASAWRVAPMWVRSGAVGGWLYLAVQLAGNTWNGGVGYFGYRLILEPLLLWTPLLALAWQEWTARRAVAAWAFGVLAWASMVCFALGATRYVTPPLAEATRWSRWEVAGLLTDSPSSLILAVLFASAVVLIVIAYARTSTASDNPSPGQPHSRTRTNRRRHAASTPRTPAEPT